MRLVRYTDETPETGLGVLHPSEDVVIDVQSAGSALDVGMPANTKTLLEQPRWAEKLELASTYGLDTGIGRINAEAISLAAPIASPQKIICIGLNYAEHVEESDEAEPDNPILFSKYPTSIIGPDQPIRWNPDLTSKVDYEVELAMVIGKRGRDIDESNAHEFVAGYTVANDVSARDLQFNDEQWTRGKSLDTFCPLGPSIVTTDEVDDPGNLALWAELNGERLQESTTEDLIFGLNELVSFCSRAFTLVPGDVILTGTPPGVGVFRDPPILLDDGDEITVGVDDIGELTNTCQHTQ